jgi:hypothetical protein
MRDENPPPSPPPTEGDYPLPPPPAHREPDWKRQAKKRERIAALVVLPTLLGVIIAAVVARAATTDDPTADSPRTTSTESPTTTTEVTTTQSGTLRGLLVTPPLGVDQARADAFAAAVTDALVAAGWPFVRIDAEFLQASLTLMTIYCGLLDSVAAIDPAGAEAVADRILASIPETVAALEANGVTPDQAALLEAMPGRFAAMFTAAADYLCPQHAEALDNAVANAARAQP